MDEANAILTVEDARNRIRVLTVDEDGFTEHRGRLFYIRTHGGRATVLTDQGEYIERSTDRIKKVAL